MTVETVVGKPSFAGIGKGTRTLDWLSTVGRWWEENVRRPFRQTMYYRTCVNELKGLDDRILMDIGVAPHQIEDIAWETACRLVESQQMASTKRPAGRVRAGAGGQAGLLTPA